jgi:hypothetical protein
MCSRIHQKILWKPSKTKHWGSLRKGIWVTTVQTPYTRRKRLKMNTQANLHVSIVTVLTTATTRLPGGQANPPQPPRGYPPSRRVLATRRVLGSCNQTKVFKTTVFISVARCRIACPAGNKGRPSHSRLHTHPQKHPHSCSYRTLLLTAA